MKRIIILFLIYQCVSAASPVKAAPFSDVPEDHWAYMAVWKLASEGILIGYPDGTFRGDEPITRYEAAVVLERLYDIVSGRMNAGEIRGKARFKSKCKSKFLWISDQK